MTTVSSDNYMNTDTSPPVADTLRDKDIGEMSVMLSVDR